MPANIRIHNVFHVSLLKKYINDPTHMIDWNLVQVEPMHILDRREIPLWNRVVAQVKVQWRHFSPEEATWELEGDLRKYHPIMFQGRDKH